LASTNFTASGGPTSESISYQYYADGSRSQMALSALTGHFSYSYDAVGRLTGLVNPYVDAFSWSYLANNWCSGQTSMYSAKNTVLDNTSYTYNALGQTTDLLNSTASGSRLSEFGYNAATSSAAPMTYDVAGNRLSMACALPNANNLSGNTSYSYDNKNELTGETSTRNSGYTNSFTYDAAENATTLRSTSGLTYNSDNQRLSSNTAYDGNGNPTTYGGHSLAFDPEDRMTSYSTSGTAVLQAGYSAGGLRSWKQSGGATTYYLYDGATPVAELSSTGTVLAVNTFGALGLTARYSGTSEEYYIFDTQGSVAERINSSGGIDTNLDTDAFGAVASSASFTDPFGYEAQAGYYTDQSTGLILTTFRYYDPANGRFLNSDPIGPAGGINAYGYCGNNATSETDPLGLWGFGALGDLGSREPAARP
jgi:RHS repeat-associated protein